MSKHSNFVAHPIAAATLPAITIGLDLSDKNAHWCAVEQSGTAAERGCVRLTASELRKQFGAMAPARIALEVSGQSAWVADVLTSLGHEVIVANARELRSITGSCRKSDPRDAEQLARLARVDPALLHPVRHRRPTRRLDLMIIRSRAVLVECRTRLVSSVRGQAKVFGERIPPAATENFAERALAALPPTLAAVLTPVIQQIQNLTNAIGEYDRQIAELAHKYEDEVMWLEQINGVGTLTAVCYVLTLDNYERFAHSRDAGPFLGLVRARGQSGESDPDLGITKAGDKYLRKLLVQCAQHIFGRLGQPSALRDWGLRLAAGGTKAKKRAVVAVARKLAVLLHCLWKKHTVYRPYPNPNQQAA
ncbi:MAG: IS110 family transposase [Bryobacterales bacterium]|nr:IS110 family transposase [Bryobacterales bacterium]